VAAADFGFDSLPAVAVGLCARQAGLEECHSRWIQQQCL
jgi:hypothetical protein